MPDVTVTIGGRDFTVACQEGEEDYLRTAAGMLDEEASTLVGRIGRLPDTRMLLMAGLMLADRTAAFAERARAAETALAEIENRPPPAPERVEVPVVPTALRDTIAEMTARAEALAEEAESRLGE
jgi:cell division protein ZapA